MVSLVVAAEYWHGVSIGGGGEVGVDALSPVHGEPKVQVNHIGLVDVEGVKVQADLANVFVHPADLDGRWEEGEINEAGFSLNI